MSDLQLIAAATEGDVDKARELLDQGADVHESDEQGWTPLNWAAGKGDAEMVRLLLERGADVTVTGRDNRTPLMIAKAADRQEVTEVLKTAEQDKGVWEDPRETRPYCKAHYLRDLRKFPDWSEKEPSSEAGDADTGDGDASELTDDSIVYIHQDFTVTRSMWHGEDVVFDDVTPEWQRFCEVELEFAVPEDLL